MELLIHQLGKITVPQNNVVIIKDKEEGIYGTGHNSILTNSRNR